MILPELKVIRCDQIVANPTDNPSRDKLTPASCKELAATIEANGLIQPPTVRPVGDGYALVIGFRRFTAVSVNLGWDHVTCIVREMTREEGLIENVIENLQRQDLSYWEQCCGLRQAFPEVTSMAEISRKISYSPSWVKLRWMFWDLPESLRDGVEAGIYGPAEVGVILQQDPKDRVRAAAKLKSGKAAGETVKDLQRALTGRKNHRSKKEIKRFMTVCMESGHLEGVQCLRYACGEISDTLCLDLLDNPPK